MDAPNGNVSLAISLNGVAVVSFYHPAQNALTDRLLKELAAKIIQAGNDDQTKIIVIKSEGDRTFCAGASFDELLQVKDKDAGAAFFEGFANVIDACSKVPKIVVVRVQGKAVGGGVGLAAAADYCLASNAASIKLSELAIGIGPFVISPAVIRKIGLPAFTQLTLRATDFQTAQWAKEKGLYNEVYDDIPQLNEALETLVQKLVTYNPEALMLLKSVLWEGTADWSSQLKQKAALSGQLVLSEFTQRALNDFKNGGK